MNFGSRTPAEESLRIIERALEQGVTHLDTANIYSDGESEKIVGEALQGRRERITVATKVGLLRQSGKAEGLSTKRVLAALDESLARLKTDYVDVYYLHAPDPATPIGQTLDALQQLLNAEKIRAWAVSNFASWQILELMVEAERREMPRPQRSQVLYNLLIRQLDVEYFAFSRKYALHSTIYNPLAAGLLAGAARSKAPSRFDSNPLYKKRYAPGLLRDLTGQYEALAAKEGMSLLKLAYAWVAGRPGVDSVLIGPSTLEQLDSSIEACETPLSEALRARIDEIYRHATGTDASYAR